MLKTIKTDILPSSQYFVNVEGNLGLDKKAICVFAATGFFLDNDTYWENIKTLRPGTINQIDENDNLLSSSKWFEWHYSPRKISFEDAVQEFTDLFDKINRAALQHKNIILPISGGLDSRSQAVSLLPFKSKIKSYSYSFEGGFKESKIAKKIAHKAGFDFQEFFIPKGYLWDLVDDAATINKCYAEFTHCRQLAVLEHYNTMGEVFTLGHWGDVLFDKITDKNLSQDEQVAYLLKGIVKPNGLLLAEKMWTSWKLPGDFKSYLTNRITELLLQISITDVNAKLRTFKTLYWAPRWTSINLSFFREKHPISLPYYHNEMCEFVCSIPENYLADRKIQIAYIKNKAPEIAKVTWQDQRPFNLYNFHKNRTPYNLPYRITNKLQRTVNNLIGKKYVQRNWELQFLGKENTENLIQYLSNSNLTDVIEKKIIDETVAAFYDGNQKKHTSHSLSILLTLAAFSNHYLHNKKEHIKNS